MTVNIRAGFILLLAISGCNTSKSENDVALGGAAGALVQKPNHQSPKPADRLPKNAALREFQTFYATVDLSSNPTEAEIWSEYGKSEFLTNAEISVSGKCEYDCKEIKIILKKKKYYDKEISVKSGFSVINVVLDEM